MPQAILNDVVLADSPTTVIVEGNHYFPADSVSWDHFESSRSKTVCPWKGVASYHHARAADAVIDDVAWTYQRPSPLARRIRGHVAFDPRVRIEPSPNDAPPTPTNGPMRRLARRLGGQSGGAPT
jgi:uncharacterized protein (DUF427 family)